MFIKKKIFLFLFLLFLIASECFSQLGMKLEINGNNFIQYENIFAVLLIRNMSSLPLFFGESDELKGSLEFDVRDSNGYKIDLRNHESGDLLLGEVLKPGAINEVTVSLSQLYAINKPGKYTVKAIIHHSKLVSGFQSNTASFTVNSGALVWETDVGVPIVEGDKNERVKERSYEIKTYFNGLNKIYCLIVSDKKYIYGVAKIGIDAGLKNPQCLIDDFSRLHILLKNQDGKYDYYIYDVNCNLDDKESYLEVGNSIPALELNKDSGEINVVGGKLIIEEGNENYQ